jgi:hypothetical protein
MKEPTRGLRLWVMVIVGTAFIILGIGEIARAWAVDGKAPQDLEISLALIGVGLVMLFFGTPDQGNAATLLSPGAKLPPDSPAAQSPERQSESSTTPRGPND